MALTPEQKNALLSAKAWWQEGERRLDYLGERAKYQNLLEQAATARDRFCATKNPVASDAVPLLRLARAFAPNGAVNRARETDQFARALHALLFDDTTLSERLSDFLQTVRGVGALTASQLLFLAYPDQYPFVTREAIGFLSPSSEQKRAARTASRELYGETDDPQTASLLTYFALLDTARTEMNLPDFADFDAVFRHVREMPKGTTRKKRGTANAVREAETAYDAPPNPEVTEAELLRYLEAFATAQGLTYPALAIRNYYLCHKTKPFVILAGLSGTGKTRLTELLAEGITGNLRSRYRLLPVRPDWSDPSPLLGYHNALTGNYIGTPFLDLLKEAGRTENRDRSYFVCLDEMNMASPNHYLSDILSVMESTDKTIYLQGEYAITLPPNLFISGTLNIDESSQGITRKVLDRANTIEFTEVDFQGNDMSPLTDSPQISPSDRERLFLTNRVATFQAARERLAKIDPSYSSRIITLLSELNEILVPRSMHFGYRVRDEIMRYIAASFSVEGEGLLIEERSANLEVALDFQTMQKVLPRLSGTIEALQQTMANLESWSIRENLIRTTAKIRSMRRRAAEDGFITFYEL